MCDANDHVKRLPTFLGPVLSRLKQGASVVITLKFHGRGMKSDDAGHELLAAALPVRERSGELRGLGGVGAAVVVCAGLYSLAELEVACRVQSARPKHVLATDICVWQPPFCPCLQELEPGRCVWLMANTLCERTYVTRKR